MENYTHFDNLDDMITFLKEKKIKNIILATIDETRPKQINKSGVEVGPCKITEIIAYHKNQIFKHTIQDVDLKIIEDKLAMDNFEVSIRNRNIV